MSADNQQERPKNFCLNPWYITGFVEGEGSFHVALYKDLAMKQKVKIIPEFHISQLNSRKEILEVIKDYFGCGYLKENHRSRFNDRTFVYVVRNRNNLTKKIIPFFKKYPFKSNKQLNFQLFEKIVGLMAKGVHKTHKGVRQIINYAYQMNYAGKYRRLDKNKFLIFLESSETICQTPILRRGKI